MSMISKQYFYTKKKYREVYKETIRDAWLYIKER